MYQFSKGMSIALHNTGAHVYGRYWFMKVETIVSADLFGMGNASGHPVRWSIIVRICIFPEVDVSHSATKSIAILSSSLSAISLICSG